MDNFLAQKSAEGDHQGAGSFTLDLAAAADKLTAFALPSHAHYLLKIIQVAQQVQAQEVEIRVERFRTKLRFHAPLGSSITDPESLFQAFCAPLVISDPVLKDLVSGLLGTINENNLETLWSFSHGHSGRRIFIDQKRRFSIEPFTLSKPRDPELPAFTFTLSVLHPKRWKFWKDARRRAEIHKVVTDNCRFCGIKVTLDGKECPLAATHELNSHLTVMKMNDFLGVLRPHPVAAYCVCYDMASNAPYRFSLLRPSLSAFVVRENDLNLWAPGTRVNNTLAPDSLSSAAWMLQFQERDKLLSMRVVPKRVPCRAVLVVNRHPEIEDAPLRLKVVRHGILVLDKLVDEDDRDYEDFKGCVLVMCGHHLATDLTGLQVVENQAFREAVLSHRTLLPAAFAYAERAQALLTM